ncbi:unnamed protein product [Durusdinium trenchii]|uniref:Uncharacterized protein n=2 Tax=Durusdinium trenchii TaxID=1381693 RepID=A0ABP0MZQ4_9DINO
MARSTERSLLRRSTPRDLRLESSSPLPGSWGGPASEHDFWKQTVASCELHQLVVKRHRLRASRECAAKAKKIWQAFSDLQDLLTAMEQQYTELCDEDDPDGSGPEWRTDGNDGHRLLVDSLQQRLLDQQAVTRQLREDISQATWHEQKAQEAELKLLAEAQAFEIEMRELRLRIVTEEQKLTFA